MNVLSPGDEARLHREVMISTLRAALKAWGTHRDFAARIGRTRVYLEYLLREDGIRIPGPETVRRIVGTLPLPAQQREELQQHMLLAAEKRVLAQRAVWQEAAEISTAEALERMRAAHWGATYADDPETARAQYRFLHDLGLAMLQQKALQHHPLILVETCLLLHDVASVLDRHGDALYYARLAQKVMRRLDRGDYRRSLDRFDHFMVNVPYAEAVTLTTIGLPLPATKRIDAVLVDAASMNRAGTFWLPHLYRHRLEAIRGLARFSQHQARELASDAKRACEKRRDPLDAQVSFLIDMSLARAYLRYDRQTGNTNALNKAYRLLRPEMESLQNVSYVGPIHRLSILTTYARVCWRKREYDEWAHVIHEALTLALAAGLQHQVREIWEEYGEVLLPLGFPENALNPGDTRTGPFLPLDGA